MHPDSSNFQLLLIAVESTPSCVFTLGKSYFVSTGFSYCANNHSVNLKRTLSKSVWALIFLISTIAFTELTAA